MGFDQSNPSIAERMRFLRTPNVWEAAGEIIQHDKLIADLCDPERHVAAMRRLLRKTQSCMATVPTRRDLEKACAHLQQAREDFRKEIVAEGGR